MKSRFFVFGVVVVSMLSGCSSGANTQGNSSNLPVAQLLVGAEDFAVNLIKVNPSDITEYDSAIDGVFPYKCPGITKELLSHVDKAIVMFRLPANFEKTERNNDFNVIQEVFRFETAGEAEAVIDAVQLALSTECSHTNEVWEEYLFNFKKLTLSDGPLIGFTWEVTQVQDEALITCGGASASYRNTYWANISGRDVYITKAEGTACSGDPENSFYSDTLNAAQEAVNALGN